MLLRYPSPGSALVCGSLAVLTACSGWGEGPEGSPTPSPTPVVEVTWTEHIEPVMQRTCQRCHVPGGQAPTDFSTYEGAAPFADLIAAYVQSGLMPPAAADPECRPYRDSETRTIDDEERALFQAWAAQDAPLGDPADAPPPVAYHHQLTDADLELRIQAPYRPTFDATGNTYTCFVLETGRDSPFYINAIQALVDRYELVHHIVLFRDEDGNARSVFGDAPFKCMNSDDSEGLSEVWTDWSMMASWGPGGPPIDLGEGRGMAVHPEQALVLQMHYFESSPDAADLSDQSGIKIRSIETVEQEVIQAAVGTDEFVIPAGDDNYTYTWSFEYNYPTRLTLLGVFPHMHVLGKSYRYWIESRDGGETCLVESERYDFHNQETYMYLEPVELKLGDTITTQCTWNNSPSNPNLIYNPPQEVRYGEGTDEEMCFFLTLLAYAP